MQPASGNSNEERECFCGFRLTAEDANGRILAGAVQGLGKLKEAGCHLFLCFCGLHAGRYCWNVAQPDIVIDDMPATCVLPFLYDVGGEGGWVESTGRILEEHVD